MSKWRMLARLGTIMSLAVVGAVASCSSTPAGGSGDDSTGSDGDAGQTSSRHDGSVSSGDDGASEGDDGAATGDGGETDGGTIQSSNCPITDDKCPANSCTQTSFVNLAPPMLSALDKTKSDPLPTPEGGAPPAGVKVPDGWNFYAIDGTVCRDGSQNGMYVRYQDPSKKLVIYLEGGGACNSSHFCDHNPQNIYEVFPGGSQNGEAFTNVLVTQAGLQAPYTTGIFDLTQADNPFKDWNQVYIPYCTGDVHFGTIEGVNIPDSFGNARNMHFMGYPNMQKFIGHLVPTFPDLDQVVLTGASAGGLGAGLNLGMVQDAFGKVPVSVLDDSGPPFIDTKYLAACLQKEYRDTWGFDKALPSDCKECTNSDGSGLTNIVFYWHHKYPGLKLGLISTLHDQIIRLFFAAGANNCASNDPNILSNLAFAGSDPPGYPAQLYEDGLDSLRTYTCTNAIGTYYIGTGDPDASDDAGTIDTLHQHIFRDRFYAPLAGPGKQTLAQWTGDFVAGKVTQVGP